MAAPSPTNTNLSQDGPAKTQTSALVVITTLFFTWGFITCMNDILIPYLKEVFDLGYFQAMLIQFAFFGAYFIGSLVYFLISIRQGDPISRIGYKNGILIGLGISAVGCALFYPAAEFLIYGFFLGALFILGLGFTMLQIAANPYVARLGPAETASSRLNLAQAFNAFGTTIAPVIGGYVVFTFFAKEGVGGADAVKIPYLILAAFFVLLAFWISRVDLPSIGESGSIEKDAGALRYPYLVLGGVAIFCYVGGEVTIGSIIVNFFEELMGMQEAEASTYLSFYWGGAMIGRFLGAISLSGMQNKVRQYGLMALAAVLTFGLLLFIGNRTNGITFAEASPFLIFIALNFGAFLLGAGKPARTLAVFASAAFVLLLVVIFSGGNIAFWSVLGIGLFNSIMWSNIFTLAIDDLGKYTSQGSSILVMMILGGALIPPIQGLIADASSVQPSFAVALICYAYLCFYGLKGYQIGKTSTE
ncbi:MAG: sugar MFS transporter [Bacteroidota bacterium]